MKSIINFAFKEWSFYAFIVFSPLNWMVYISIFGTSNIVNFADTPNNFNWFLMLYVFNVVINLVFFIFFIQAMRKDLSDDYSRTKLGLTSDLFLHAIKSFLCIIPFPIAFLYLTAENLMLSVRQFGIWNSTKYGLWLILIPANYILIIWFISGFSYVVFASSCKKSIRRSFSVMNRLFNPLALIALILLVLGGWPFVRHQLIKSNGIIWSIADIVPLYLSEVVFILGMSYIVYRLAFTKYGRTKISINKESDQTTAP